MAGVTADQLTLFCPTCCGALVVVTEARNHDGDPTLIPVPCPSCRPSVTAQETWLAVAALGHGLTGAQR